MSEKMMTKATNISRIILYIVAAIILLWINRWSLRIFTVVLGVLSIALSMILAVLLEKYQSKILLIERIVLGVGCLLFWAACTWWVYIVPYHMEADQAIVWTAADIACRGDLSMYAPGGQIGIYPQQQGLAFLYEMLFRIFGTNDHQMIGYVNAALAPITLFCGYQSVKECSDTHAALRFFPIMMFCLPYIVYSPYVYGDIPSICFCFVLLWAILKCVNTGKYRYGAVACLAASMAYLSRKNVILFFIGLFIAFVLHSVKKKSLKPVLLASGVILCAIFTMEGIKEWNSYRSGFEPSEGMPAVLWVAMGMQDCVDGPGQENMYGWNTYMSVLFDNEKASEIGWQEIKDRAAVFRESPDMAKWFYTEKIRSQWVDPMFESAKFTGTFGEKTYEELPGVVQWFYQGPGFPLVEKVYSQIMSWMYFMAFLGVVLRFFKKKDIVYDIPLIVFVGGFLFCIIWEAKARYMFPYYVLVQIYAAYGLYYVSEVVLQKIKTKGDIY